VVVDGAAVRWWYVAVVVDLGGWVDALSPELRSRRTASKLVSVVASRSFSKCSVGHVQSGNGLDTQIVIFINVHTIVTLRAVARN
jgi:hypothetical protein